MYLTKCGEDCDREATYLVESPHRPTSNFHILYGFECIGWDKPSKDRCPSSDHVNNPKVNSEDGFIHKDGGYTLKQKWL